MNFPVGHEALPLLSPGEPSRSGTAPESGSISGKVLRLRSHPGAPYARLMQTSPADGSM
jgi:hypothetical protein